MRNFIVLDKGLYNLTSLLHHQFEFPGYGEKNTVLQMDNCAVQNKNITVIGYVMLQWK
jgi:hypothetical protein